MNRIYRALGLFVLLAAATVTLFFAFDQEADDGVCSTDGIASVEVVASPELSHASATTEVAFT